MHGGTGQRRDERRAVALPARLTWKDQSGAVRFVSVTTRNVSDGGMFVECDHGAAIPLHRLVHVQVERSARVAEGPVPAVLTEGRVLAAIWRVAPCRPATGTPSGYALRLLVEPRTEAPLAIASRPVEASVAVAS